MQVLYKVTMTMMMTMTLVMTMTMMLTYDDYYIDTDTKVSGKVRQVLL